METLTSLFKNHILSIGLISFVLAQLAKTIIVWVTKGRFVSERLIGAGGMPSAHSALVCSVTVAIARVEGIKSSLFALSIFLAFIIMYDAMGVRRAAGEQAKAINKIVFHFNQRTPDEEDMEEPELKEYIGHTPLEVLGGALFGILVSMIYFIIAKV